MMRALFISFLLMASAVAFSQKTEKVTGTYTYYAPENMTLEEAKRTALDRAKISAIADAFGTLVTQSNSTVMTSQNGKTDSRFFSLGGSEVKGEWIETTHDPIYKISYEDGMLVVSVEVRGIIREIVSAGIDFTAKILRNGTEEKFESNEFRSGDDMYLYFKSPVDGYLAVYLLDETTNIVYRILPYIKSNLASFPVKADKDYVFFKKERTADYIVDEYTMTANQPIEFNTFFVIFSPTKIIKANDSSDEKKDGIRVLEHNDFKKWLVGVRRQTSSKVIEYSIIVKQ